MHRRQQNEKSDGEREFNATHSRKPYMYRYVLVLISRGERTNIFSDLERKKNEKANFSSAVHVAFLINAHHLG